jgi:hypothetical protein
VGATNQEALVSAQGRTVCNEVGISDPLIAVHVAPAELTCKSGRLAIIEVSSGILFEFAQARVATAVIAADLVPEKCAYCGANVCRHTVHSVCGAGARSTIRFPSACLEDPAGHLLPAIQWVGRRFQVDRQATPQA